MICVCGSPTILVTPLIELRSSPGFDVHRRWDPQWQPARLGKTMESSVAHHQCPYEKMTNKLSRQETPNSVGGGGKRILHFNYDDYGEVHDDMRMMMMMMLMMLILLRMRMRMRGRLGCGC